MMYYAVLRCSKQQIGGCCACCETTVGYLLNPDMGTFIDNNEGSHLLGRSGARVSRIPPE